MEKEPLPAQVGGVAWHNRSRLKTVLIYEFLGTALVTYAFTLSNQSPLIRGLAYFIVFVLAFHISGAHFNPATSFACYISDLIGGCYHNEELKSGALK